MSANLTPSEIRNLIEAMHSSYNSITRLIHWGINRGAFNRDNDLKAYQDMRTETSEVVCFIALENFTTP